MNLAEFVIIVVVAFVVIGPERLPEYAAKARQGVRDLKRLADGARTQLRDQLGPEFDDIDWRAYDPRQYDPRRIVRDALRDDPDALNGPGAGEPDHPAARPMRAVAFDPDRPVPVDHEAT